MKSVVFTHLISFPLCSVEKKLRRFACETNGTMYKFFWRESVGVCPPPKFICDVTTYPYARTRTRGCRKYLVSAYAGPILRRRKPFFLADLIRS